jgi:hypothetical protein
MCCSVRLLQLFSFRVEKILDVVFPGDLEQKTARLLKLFPKFDSPARSALCKLLKDKKRFV